MLFQEEFENGGFSTKFLQSLEEKYLVAEWLSWLPYKSGYIISKILEISKDRPNTPPSLKWLQQRVHELEGRVDLPPPLDNVVGSKRLKSGRVNL